MAVTALAADLNGPLEVYSPEWWVKRLLAKLRTRAIDCEEYATFYEGKQPLAFASQKFAETFGRRYSRLPSNFMPLVVKTERERMIVQGFRFGKPDADKGVWRIWQANQLDAESQIAHEIALVKGVAYTMVSPSPSGPLITIEDPSETILETAPGNRRIRLAALKVWLDDDGYMRAYLFLPDLIYKYRSVNRRTDDGSWAYESVQWQPYREEGEDFPVTNSLGVVPIIPLLNNPRRDGTGRSELAPVMGNQNAINKLRFDALVASEYVAFPQRWITNIDIPVDPATGQDIAPFRPGVDNLWAVRRPSPEDMAEYDAGKFPMPTLGQFPAGDLSPYINAIELELGLMATGSSTPYYVLFGTPSAVPPTGESIKSSEAPLVRKIVAQEVHFGEGWEETMRLALIANGQSSKARTDAEIDWADVETRNEAARTDSILKQYQAGLLPDEIALEELGYSLQQINRIGELKAAAKTATAPDSLAAEIDSATALVHQVRTGTLGSAQTGTDAPGAIAPPATNP